MSHFVIDFISEFKTFCIVNAMRTKRRRMRVLDFSWLILKIPERERYYFE